MYGRGHAQHWQVAIVSSMAQHPTIKKRQGRSMARAKNVLWIMCDQLRYDYLGCTGHPTLKTPNIDAMAKRGVLFTNAYVQSPICGPSRMSFYTGRYMRSHGSHWNGWPLRVGEPTLGDHLKTLCVTQCAGRQDPHGNRSRGAEDARHRARFDHRRACQRMRL